MAFSLTAESHQSGVLCTLAMDVGTVSGDLKAINKRLDSMTSLLLGIASGQHQAASAINPTPQSEDINRRAPAAGGVGGVWSLAGGAGGGSGVANTSQNPAATARGGFGRSDVGGGWLQTAPSFPTDPQQGWQGRALLSQPTTRQPCPARLYSALPNVSKSMLELSTYSTRPEAGSCCHRRSRAKSARLFCVAPKEKHLFFLRGVNRVGKRVYVVVSAVSS